MAEADGQLIYMRVLSSHDNKYHGLQATTLDNPTLLARKFAYDHNLRLTEQIKLKKLV